MKKSSIYRNDTDVVILKSKWFHYYDTKFTYESLILAIKLISDLTFTKYDDRYVQVTNNWETFNRLILS